ncbi:ubiquitin thioesterase Zranb1 [Hippocampus zosterae]|uniref:ubiquitin thioesterase Zranb1 n=1 Tax=Hippocampus zosterae TaxID=109293 RepID=UPI00223E23A1|nr:ubiquitin thioesterase Zranb1 [Hippocampus zosterae]
MTDAREKWACDYCTYENWPSATKCTMCRAHRSRVPIITEEPYKSGPDADPARRPWDLRAGEGGGLLICPDSSARPRVRPAGMAEIAAKWSCHMCTYLNWPRAVRCTQCLCRRPKNGSPTESPHASGCRPAPPCFPADPCEEYNDRNRLDTRRQYWTCSSCTYQNSPVTLTCVACESPQAIELAAPSAERSSVINEQERAWRSGRAGGTGPLGQGRSPYLAESEASVQMDFQRIEVAAAAVSGKDERETDFKKLKQIRNRMRKTDWLFLSACAGVVEGDLAPVEAYKSSGGDIARQLSADEVQLLNRASAFDAGFTLVHLAIRFQRQDMLAVLLTEVTQRAAKRIPSMACPELTEQIRREIVASLHQRKGDFACYFLSDLVTFTLPADIEDLPPAVQEKLFDEVLDRDVQKELEEDSAVINWSMEPAGTRLDSRLYALWNRTAGDCLLDSVLQATWGIYDKDSVLRKTLHDSLHDCSHWFYTRWKEWESWYSQSFGLHFSLREEQWQEDWAFILSLASQPGASLEQTHIFVLAHILRRPIIVYGVKYYKSFRGETLGYARFQGVYLPLLWEQSFCWKSPIALGYTRGHFSALVAMENDGYGDNRGAGANLDADDDVTVTFLPLVDSERKLLHIHFLSAQEMGNEEQQEKLLRSWLDCSVTDGGMLAAVQKSSRRRNHPLVTQMLEKWLDTYR